MPYLTGVKQALDLVHRQRRGNDNDEASLSSKTAGQMILSDGNTLFIGQFLDANGLSKHFNSNHRGRGRNRDRDRLVL